MKNLKLFILALALSGLTVAGIASAQEGTMIGQAFGATYTQGIGLSAYNTADSTILDGSLVQIDTTSTKLRFGVKLYTGTLSDRKRIVGLAWGDIPKSSLNRSGRVLLFGFHSFARVSTSNIAAGAPLRVGTLQGSMKDAGDSMSMQCGYVVRGASGTIKQGRYGAATWFWGMGHFLTGSL